MQGRGNSVEHEQIMEQTAQREVYEPPMLAEIGQFAELTSGGGQAVPDSLTGGSLHQ
jgi:hypothetical protein